MWSSSVLLVLFAHVFTLGVVANRDIWLKALPKCWQGCFEDTEDGCSSSSCVCNTSESSASYLPSAVSCAVSECGADDWALELVLGPLALLCVGLQCPIPKDTLADAYAAASEGDAEPSPTPAPVPTTSKKADHTTSRASKDSELTSIIPSTLTQTTTDSSGNTLQVIVPIAVGPSGIVTGSASTSTLSGRATVTRISSLVPSSPSAAASLPDLSLLSSSTSTSAPQRTGGSSGGNGSPFDTPAAASKWSLSIPLLGLGGTVILFMRL